MWLPEINIIWLKHIKKDKLPHVSFSFTHILHIFLISLRHILLPLDSPLPRSTLELNSNNYTHPKSTLFPKTVLKLTPVMHTVAHTYTHALSLTQPQVV